MLFNSYIFIFLFLPLCIAGYYLLPGKAKKIWLTGMSLWFYAYFNVSYLPLILVSICVNYLVYQGIVRVREKNRRLSFLLLTAGLIFNLGLLFYYKYADFFIENINGLFKTDIPFIRVLLPLGISFFTFQQIGFIVDAWKGELEETGFIDYSLFVTFFPQLIAGPIVTHQEILWQFADTSRKKFSAENMSKGIYAFVCGLSKKVLIADIFGKAVDWGFADISQVSGLSAAWIIVSYAVQLYFDFSGYSDMARGIALMFNIELPLNFDSPYKAVSLLDFWKRWHITLSRFFTRYVYFTLGGSRKGHIRTCINIFLIYFVSGIWHGAGWTFVVWGALMGAVYVLQREINNYFKPVLPKGVMKYPVLLSGWLFQMIFFLFTLTFFRAESVNDAVLLLRSVFSGSYDIWALPTAISEAFNTPEFFYVLKILKVDVVKYAPMLLTSGYMVVAWIILLFTKNVNEKLNDFKPTIRGVLWITLLFIWSIVSFSQVSSFLYFNF